MKSTHASQKSRAIRFLWLLEVVIIVLAVLGSAWLRFLNDQETHLEFVEHAPAPKPRARICAPRQMPSTALPCTAVLAIRSARRGSAWP